MKFVDADTPQEVIDMFQDILIKNFSTQPGIYGALKEFQEQVEVVGISMDYSFIDYEGSYYHTVNFIDEHAALRGNGKWCAVDMLHISSSADKCHDGNISWVLPIDHPIAVDYILLLQMEAL